MSRPWDEGTVRSWIDALRAMLPTLSAQELPAALAAHHPLFATFMEHLPAAVCIRDPESRVIYANRFLKELMGWTACEGKTVHELLPREVADRMAADNRRALGEGLIAVRETLRDSQGRPRVFHTYKFPVPWKDDLTLLGTIAVDLTERFAAEEALRESEQRYRQLYELESDALVLVENGTGRILEVNEAAVRLYGYTREEWLGMKHTDVSAEPEQTRQVTQAGECVVPLRWHRKKDGTVFPVEITATFSLYQGRNVHLAAIRDITARQRLEAERERLIADLQSALAQVKALRGLLPICAGCKRIRNESGEWDPLEAYLSRHTEARFSHGLCPTCLARYDAELPGPEPGGAA